MRRAFFSAARFFLFALLAMPIACCDQGPPAATEIAAKMRALIVLPAKNGETLAVTSPAFKDGGDIPFENTQYKGNVFPGLSWTAGPAGTQSYAIIMQDGDGLRHNSQPILHWTMANIPPAVTRLATKMTAPPDGATFGPNGSGTNQPYLGPRTPAGPRHRYHFQVFALDTLLPPDSLATFEAMTAAMDGRVLASGELVGLGRAP